VQVLPWRGNPNFVGPLIVALETRVDLLGDFHLLGGSPAIGIGASAKDPNNPQPPFAPLVDIDGDARGPSYDAGADQVVTPTP
jgi:hypothetical protein